MSPKASSRLAVNRAKQEIEEEAFYSPKLEVLVRSPNGLVKCPVSTDAEVISIGGRITVSF